jgi:hypothetical protein
LQRLRVLGGTRSVPGDYDYDPATPYSLDLRGTTLAFAWGLEADSCIDDDPEAKEEPGAFITEIWLWRRGASRRLEAACSLTAVLGSPSLYRGSIGYVREDDSSVFRRMTLDGVEVGDTPLGMSEAASHDDGMLVYVRLQADGVTPARWLVTVSG